METKQITRKVVDGAIIISLDILQERVTSLDQIVEMGHLKEEDSLFLSKQSKKFIDFLFYTAPSPRKQKIILYWGGENQSIPGGPFFYKYFFGKGYRVVADIHPSILFKVSGLLTKELLEESGIPGYVDIVLPVLEGDLLPYDCFSCFPAISYNDGSREIDLVKSRGPFNCTYVFLLGEIEESSIL